MACAASTEPAGPFDLDAPWRLDAQVRVRPEGGTMADVATAELAEETAVTGPADDIASDLADDVLVEEVSIDGMCGVY